MLLHRQPLNEVTYFEQQKGGHISQLATLKSDCYDKPYFKCFYYLSWDNCDSLGILPTAKEAIFISFLKAHNRTDPPPQKRKCPLKRGPLSVNSTLKRKGVPAWGPF